MADNTLPVSTSSHPPIPQYYYLEESAITLFPTPFNLSGFWPPICLWYLGIPVTLLSGTSTGTLQGVP